MSRSLLPLLLLGAMIAMTPLIATQAAETRARLDVQAEAQREVVPDRATLSARLWERTPAIARDEDTGSDATALREARDRLEERATELIRTLEEAGLERDAISAGSLNVHPEHIPGTRTSEGEREMLVRTRLERPFQIKVANLESLPLLLDAMTDARVNALDGVTYDLADRDAASDEALVMALEKARHKAELMASTLGVTLGSVINVSETHAPVYAPRMMAMSADMRESVPQAEYRPGTIIIEAAVSVSWEIDPQP
ncbi:DUF541 domain-containing protein [Halomonas sp. DQ26W]|uniref:SIMPL domain-containing protein n=1 Tax=Halomonas sp. DQ26W TaxID=2282311 RepID=UPI000DF7E725|nr:SIMPL domain-containing protein [Halomonas sp. DQ26W]RDB41894.1 DUF541 domain-containing protein [Halomonas sp. DQ26W]